MSIKMDKKKTLRGKRKCPDCGTFNGNRSKNCKNRSCQLKLRDIVDTAPKVFPLQPLSVVQLLPAYAHLYSVCLHAGVRNFIETSFSSDGTMTVSSITSGRTGPSIEVYKSDDVVSMIQLILDCKTTANAVPLQKEMINSLAISESEQQALIEKESQCTSPLVQRLDDGLFVVGRTQFAYGLCHVQALKSYQEYSHFQCNCSSSSGPNVSPAVCWHMQAVVAGLLSVPENSDERWKSLLRKFVAEPSPTGGQSQGINFHLIDESVPLIGGHIFNEQLPVVGQNIEMIHNPTVMELFCDEAGNQQALISLDAPMSMPSDGSILELAVGDPMIVPPPLEPCGSDATTTTHAESLQLMDCQIELMDEFDHTDRIDFCPSDIECEESVLFPAKAMEKLFKEIKRKIGKKKEMVEVTAKKSVLEECKPKRKLKYSRSNYNVRKLMNILESNGIIFNRLQSSHSTAQDAPGPTPEAPGYDAPGPTPEAPGYDAVLCSLSFTSWLEAVIEQLNTVIDYNAEGKPAPQTFRIHEDFFRCLRARFSVGHSLRKPDETRSPGTEESSAGAGVQRSQVFRFTHHKSLLHVFRTDRTELSFEKCFVRSSIDGRFAPIEPSKESHDQALPATGARPIRPQRYSTYIKMGRYKHEADPNQEFQFTLDWTASVLPISGFGDLTILFEYGHRINNQYVPPPGAVTDDEQL